MDFISEKREEVLKKFSSFPDGIDEQKVLESRERFGENVLEKPKKKSFIKRLLSALSEPMMLILLVSAAITLGINLGKYFKCGEADFSEFSGIIFAVGLSVSITLIMESSSQKAFDALKKSYRNVFVKVRRNGKILKIPQSEIVCGDIVIISSGDKVTADGRLLKSDSLSLDESALTGESSPVQKDAEAVLNKNVHIAEAKNYVFSGTFVSGGSGEYVVTAVGTNAEIGKIAKEIGKEREEKTPLSEKLNSLSKTVSLIGVIVSACIFIAEAIKLAVSGEFTFSAVQEIFVSCIVLIVAAVPEGLPTIVAVSLALNMIKLSGEKVLIKKLVATETTGMVSVICSDKTGTLTENKMKVVKICTTTFCKNAEEVKSDILYENFCINSTADLIPGVGSEIGTEAALLTHYRDVTKKDYKVLRNKYGKVSTIPFSSKTKYMMTAVRTDGGERRYLKGAPEVILTHCDLTDYEFKSVKKNMEEYEKVSYRILAFAHLDITETEETAYKNKEELKYVFDGFAVIADKIRKEVFSAVETAEKSGVDVKMLTGDNIVTAKAVAKQLKIITSESQAVTGADIERLSDKELKEAIKDIKVIARSTPSVKLRVVKALKELGEVVAVTGDGINDAPAIRHADVGIAMGVSGSEITKEAAEAVLLNDSFEGVIKAIEFGRTVHKNIKRFIMFQLSVNVSALIFVAASCLFGLNMPFSALELLFINVIMDGPPAITLGLYKPDKDIMEKPPVKRNAKLIDKSMWIRIILHGVYMAAVTLFEYRFNFLKVPEKEITACVFVLFTAFQLFNAFNAKELGRTSVFKTHGNYLMPVTFFITFLVLVFAVTFIPSGFGICPMSFISWVKTVATGFSIIIISEVSKLVPIRRIGKPKKAFRKITAAK